MRNRSRRSVAVAAMAAFVFGPSLAFAGDPGTRSAEGPPSSRALLRSMTDYVASLESFTFRIETTFEIFSQEQKIQFTGSADIAVRRPDGLVVDYRDDLSAKRLWYDGKELTLLDLEARAVATAAAPADLDDALDHFEERFGLVLPVSDLIGNDAYGLIASRARSASYVGLHDVEGEACHHLAFVGDEANLQLWIREGDRPLPCKLVIDYKEEPGRPQYAVVLTDWKLGERLRDSRFEPEVPRDARRITFLEVEEVRR